MNYEIETKEPIAKDLLMLSLYLILLPLDFIDVGIGSFSKFLSILVVGSIFLLNTRDMKISFKLATVIVIFIVWNYLTGLYSDYPYLTLERSTSVFLNYILIIICSSPNRNKREIDFLEKSIAISGWFVVVLMILFKDTLDSSRTAINISNMSQDPNYLCGYFIFPIIYYLRDLFMGKRIKLSIISIIVMMYCIISTGSRGGLIAVLGACFIYMVLSESNNKKIKYFILTVVSLAVIYILAVRFLPNELLMRFDIDFSKEDGGAGRLLIWKKLFREYKNLELFNKIYGVGSGTVTQYIHDVAHNLWFENLFELGIIGLIIICTVYYAFFKRTIKIKDKAYLAMFMGYFIMTLTMSLYTYKPIFVLFIIVNMVYTLNENSKDKNKSGE